MPAMRVTFGWPVPVRISSTIRSSSSNFAPKATSSSGESPVGSAPR